MKKRSVLYALVVTCLSLATFIFSLVLGPAQPARADVRMMISVDGQPVHMDQGAFVRAGTTYVPIRFLAQWLGASKLGWQGDTETVTVTDQTGGLLLLQVGRMEAVYQGQTFTLSRPLLLKEGRAYLPIRDLADKLNFSIGYDAQGPMVKIKRQGEGLSPLAPAYDELDQVWLARIVNVESRGQSMENKLATANVVLNRVKDPAFPDSIYEVIFEVNSHVQFPPAHKAGFSSSVPTEESLQAARRALLGENNIEDCLFFNNRPWSHMTDRLYKVMEGEYYYR